MKRIIIFSVFFFMCIVSLFVFGQDCPGDPSCPQTEELVINPAANTVLTSGQVASLPGGDILGSVVIQQATVNGVGFTIQNGDGIINSDGADINKGNILIGTSNFPVANIIDATFSSGKMEGICGTDCNINGVPISEGIAFSYDPKTDMVSGNCAPGTSCNIGGWDIGPGVTFDYDRSASTFANQDYDPSAGTLVAVCSFQPCQVNGVFIPSNGVLDDLLRDDPVLFQKYLDGEYLLDDYDPTLDIYHGEITVTMKKQIDTDIWDMYVEPAFKDREENNNFFFRLDQIKNTGIPTRIIIEGKNAVVFDNGDSYTHGTSGFDGVIVYPSGDIEIGSAIDYSQSSGVDIFPISPVVICYSTECQKEPEKALIKFDPESAHISFEGDFHPVSIIFKEDNPYIVDFDERSYFELECSASCSFETFNRGLEETGFGLPPLGIRQVGGNLKITSGPGSTIEANGNDVYRPVTSEDVSGLLEFVNYELVLASEQGDVLRKGFGLEDGYFLIDDRPILSDLLIRFDDTLIGDVDRPFQSYNAAKDLQEFCGDNGGFCPMRDMGRTHHDQELRFQKNPGRAVNPASGVSNHELNNAVDVDEEKMAFSITSRAERREISNNADGIVDGEVRSRLPAKGFYAYDRLRNLESGRDPETSSSRGGRVELTLEEKDALLLDFEIWASTFDLSRSRWLPVAKRHNYDVENTWNNCPGTPPCAVEGWHISHKPSRAESGSTIAHRKEKRAGFRGLQGIPVEQGSEQIYGSVVLRDVEGSII